MRIIFLDIDGVLNCRQTFIAWHDAGIGDSCHVVSREMIEVLNRIVKATGAEVIVSSCWRLSFKPLGKLNAFLKEHGAQFDLLDSTPRRYRDREGGGVHEVRGDEIQASMDVWNVKPEDVVILDDDGIGVDGGKHELDSRLILIDRSGGLQVHHIAQVLEKFGV